MKHVIWNNDVCGMYEDIKNNLSDFFEDEDVSDEEIWNQAYLEIEANLDADMANLDIELCDEIFLTGMLVDWEGWGKDVYSELDTRNIGKAMEKAIQKWDGMNLFEIYVEDGRMFISQRGHDNPMSPSIMEFRSVTDFDPFDGILESESIGEYVAKVYGWEEAIA